MKTSTSPAPANITAEQLTGLCNLTTRRLYQLADENKIPQSANGQWPMLATITALFAYYQRDGEQLSREKLLKTTAERRLREHELAKTEGKFLPLAEVAQACAAIGKTINGVINNRLEVRLRVTVLERLKAVEFSPPLTAEQITGAVAVMCAIGQETSVTLKTELRTALHSLAGPAAAS